MRETGFLLSFAASAATAFCVVAALFLAPDFATAAEPLAATEEAGRTPCSCPESSQRPVKPKFAEMAKPDSTRTVDDSDEAAALSSVLHALRNTADGAKYVWHRKNGRLSGIVNPTSSFKNADGSICRHIIVMLTTGDKTKKTEGVACRSPDGRWTLDG
jgi:surface antigen